MPTPRDGTPGKAPPRPTKILAGPGCCVYPDQAPRQTLRTFEATYPSPEAPQKLPMQNGGGSGPPKSPPPGAPPKGRSFEELLAGLRSEHDSQVATMAAENQFLRQQVASLRGGISEQVVTVFPKPVELAVTLVANEGAAASDEAQRSMQKAMAQLQETMEGLRARLSELPSWMSPAAEGSAPMESDNSKSRRANLNSQEPAKPAAVETKARMEPDPVLVPKTWSEKVAHLLGHPRFEVAVLFLIVANTVLMAFEMQYSGLDVGYLIGFRDEGGLALRKTAKESWPWAEDLFAFLARAFDLFFTVEVFLKLVFLQWSYLRLPLNWLDIIAVAGTLFEVMAGTIQGVNPMVLRLFRMMKLERGLRVMKLSRTLDTLALLLKCMAASVTTLFWSVGLLVVVQCIAGMVLSQMVREYLLDDSKALDSRLLVYTYYGTFTRTMLTMFEVTLANWGPPCRVLVDNVSEWYTMFFLFYRCVVGFAVLGVISAVFVQQTMQTAAQDNEIMVQRKKREQNAYNQKMRMLFARMDDDGNGTLGRHEFDTLLRDETTMTWMTALDIEPKELTELAHLIEDEEGNISFVSFLEGATRLRGPAKSFDMVRMLAHIGRIENCMEKVFGTHYLHMKV